MPNAECTKIADYNIYLKRQMNLPITLDFLKLTDLKLEWLNRSATRVTLDLVRFINNCTKAILSQVDQ